MAAPKPPEDRENWRVSLLNGLLFFYIAIATPILVAVIFTRPIEITIFGFAMWLMVLPAIIVRDRLHRTRAGVLCFALLTVGAVTLYLNGTVSSGRLFLGAAVVLACIFSGIRASLYTLAVSVLIVVAVGAREILVTNADPYRWSLYVASYVMVLGSLTWAVTQLVTRTDRLIEQLETEVLEKEALQMAAQRDLQELQFLNENAVDVIWTTDLDLNITYFSPNIERLRGYSPEEAIAIGFDVFEPESRKAFKALLDQRLEEDQGVDPPSPVRIPTTIRHRDGHFIDVEITVKFLRDGQRVPIGLIGTTRDISDRVRLEKSMATVIQGTQRRHGANFLDSLTQNLASALSAKAVMIGRLTEGNQIETRSVWLEGRHLDNFNYPLPGSASEGAINAGSGVMSVREGAQDRFPGDQTLTAMQIESYFGAPILDDVGETCGVIACLHDEQVVDVRFHEDMLTIFSIHASAELQRQQLESTSEAIRLQLIQSQKLDSVGQLAGGIAHDFNNLLVVMLGYVELAGEAAGGDGKLKEYLKQIQGAATRAAELTRQLLSFSRRQILELTPIDVGDLVNNLQAMLRRLLPENIHLVVENGNSIGTIQGDKSHLEQVIINLAVNARDAMPEGGHLTIRTDNVSLTSESAERIPDAEPGRYVRIQVLDTGVGMSEELMVRIFEPFFTTKPDGLGTGLGLSVMFGVVKQHQGFVDTFSEPGVGSRFDVYLPVADASLALPVAESTNGSHSNGISRETILLVEDEDEVRELTRLFLERAGYSVLTAADGTTAVNLFEQHHNDVSLVLLDVVLPDIGGRVVMERLQGIDADVAILFVSGYAESGIHVDFVLEQGLSLLRKPFLRAELLDRVKKMLTHEPH